MKSSSPNQVDGDVQALIADCQAEIEDLKRSIDRCDAIGTADYLYHLQSRLKRQYAALDALTAAPYAYASCNTDMRKESEYFSGSIFNNAWGEEYTLPLYTNPPAQLLRPVELPEPYDDGHGNLWLPQDAVIYAVKNAGGEVKS